MSESCHHSACCVGYIPLGLSSHLVLLGLSLHLLHLDGIWLASAHVQLVVPHAQRQNALVDSQPLSEKYEVLQQQEHDSTSHRTEFINLISLHISQTAKPHVMFCPGFYLVNHSSFLQVVIF